MSSAGAAVDAIASVAWCGASSSHGANGSQVIDADECRANARLIAASPTLLRVVENLVIAVAMGWDLDGVLANAEAAIALATKDTDAT